MFIYEAIISPLEIMFLIQELFVSMCIPECHNGKFIEQGYIDDGYKMCYGLTKAKISTYSEANKEEFLKEYYERPQNSIEVLTPEDIELLNHGSDEMVVFTVIALTKSEIKGEKQPEYDKNFMNVICKKQPNGKYLVYKLVN